MKKDVLNKSNATVLSVPAKPGSSYIKYGGELRLSNPGQLELLLCLQERGVPLRTAVRGFSMAPFIQDLDILTIAPLDMDGPRLGEVVAFILKESNRMAIHRVVAKKNNGWLLRGDNCKTADGVMALEQIIGTVRQVERRGREIKFGHKPGIGSFFIAWLSAHNLLLPLIRVASLFLNILRLKGRI